MEQKRKGARWLEIGTERWSYFVGIVEVVSPEGVKTLIERDKLDQDVLNENSGDTTSVTLPGKVAAYIRANLRTPA